MTDNNNNCGGWGGDWIIVLFLFALMSGFGGFGGWGGGFGGGLGGYGGGTTGADLYRAIDQNQLLNKLDGITYGITDATFALNNTMTTGFANAELSRCNQQAAFMQQLYAMAADQAKCCCETQRLMERGFADTNYNMATQACETRNTIQNTTRDLIDNQNCNARAILDAINAQAVAAKDEKIADQKQQIWALQLQASQAAQNNYLLGQLMPVAKPAYITCSPYESAFGYGRGSCYQNQCCGYGG